MYWAATGVLSGDKEEKTDGTSTSQDSGSDTQTVSGGSVATKDDSGNLTVAGVAKKAMDSCVGITVYSKQNSYSNFYGYGSNNSSDSSDNQQGQRRGLRRDYEGSERQDLYYDLCPCDRRRQQL